MIRVCSYPPRHAYVDRLHGEVAHLVDRDEAWPRLPRFWDPAWVAANAHRWDLAHLHFTWEQYPPDVVAAVLDAHRGARRPVVWTAHDLQNPHRRDHVADRDVLRLVAERADAVTALTPGSAAHVRAEFGVDATVVPHGPFLDGAAMSRLRSGRGGGRRILLHGKSLRANLDWQGVVDAAARVASRRDDLEVLLDLHAEPSTLAAARHAARAGVVVTRHAPRSHADLCTRIASVDALVLPYRWGSHSGLAELATDLGTTVVTTDVGFIAQQVPAVVVGRDARGGVDVASLTSVLHDVAEGQVPRLVPIAARRTAGEAFLDGHRRVYRSVLDLVGSSTPVGAPG